MENINNQNQSACPNGDCNKCCYGLFQKIGWYQGSLVRRIAIVFIVIFILFFIGAIFNGRGNCCYNDKVVNTISFSGKGEVVVKPNIATVSFGVQAEHLDVSKAQTEATTKMNNIIDLLKNKEVEEKDIKLTNYSIYPRYDYIQERFYPYSGKQNLAAYVVSQTVEVRIRDISKAGEILSGVGEFGVTDVSGLTFTVDNEDEVKEQARDLAINNAKAQAESLAQSLGVKLVKITNFTEGGNYPIYYKMNESMALGMGGDNATPQVPMGENKIISQVNITYEIR